jgi:hypothetical protein
MTTEKSYFICRNEDCKTEENSSGESITGGKVFEYSTDEKDRAFVCKHCGSKYREESGDIFLVFEEEISLDGSNGYKEFKARYETNRIHFRKLVLKNIHESDYKGKILSFNKCRIDELIIEDVHIISAFNPIMFSNCHINKVHLGKSKISKAKLNSYKSLWNFFGVNFFQTTIAESFRAESSETSILISGCQVLCPLDLSKKSKIDLALIHNKRNPEVNFDKGSVVNRLFEIKGRALTQKEEKVKTSGKIISNISIGELFIDPEVKKTSILENCSIGKLVFEEAASIQGKLVFRNCFIESIQNQPYCFEKDLVFLGCTFNDELIMKRLRFNKSLVFEVCTFEKNATFNELKIEEDLNLNYSVFKKGLSVSGVRCGGYVKFEINTIKDEINFEDNIVSKDINLSYVQSDSDLVMFHNETVGYLFLFQVVAGGKLDINMLNGEAVTMEEITVENSVEINQVVLKKDFKITGMEAGGDVQFLFTKIEGSILFYRSSINKDFTAIALEAGLAVFMNICFKGNSSFNSCVFSQQLWTTRNLFHESFSWDTMHTHNISFNENRISGSFTIDKTEARDIFINNNITGEDIEINNSRINDAYINDNTSKRNLNIKYLRLFDVAVNNNIIYQDFEFADIKANNLSFNDNEIKKSFNLKDSKFNNTKFYDNRINDEWLFNNSASRDIYLIRNQISKEIMLNYFSSDDLIFMENITPLVRFLNSGFGNIDIKENTQIESMAFINTSANDNFNINDNLFKGDLYIELCSIRKNINLNKNTLQNLDIKNTEANDIQLENNEVRYTLYISETRAGDLKLTENKVAVKTEEDNGNISGERSAGMFLEQCNITGGLEIERNETPETLQINESFADKFSFALNATTLFKISRGRYRQFGVYYCRDIGKFICNNVTIGKDASFSHNIFHDDFDMLYCQIGNDLEFSGNEFKDIYRLNNNTIHGSLTYEAVSTKEDGIIKTTFAGVQIINNKFNFVNLENILAGSTFYFDNNTVQGSLKIGKRNLSAVDTVISFPDSVSITENKIANAMFFNLDFESALCLQQNNFDGDLTFRNTSHHKTIDFSGCYVGGSFIFHNARRAGTDGDLVLDNTFVDKRISFNNYSPVSFSFINATFNGFEIPGEWKIKNKELVRTGDKNKPEHILKENILLKKKYKDAGLPYNLIKTHYESDDYFTDLPVIWRHLQSHVFSNEEKIKILLSIEGGKEVLNAVNYIEPCVSKVFIPVYYGFFRKETIAALTDLAEYFARFEKKFEEPEVAEIVDLLIAFFNRFFIALKFFENHVIYWNNDNDKENQQNYRRIIIDNLEEQYHVLRHIYGNNGELKEEDSAYYKWMHYKNMSDMHDASPGKKPKYWIKYVLYEKIFGWGVDLPRIVVSTIGLVLLFTVVYWLMFQFTPGLTVKWDDITVQGGDIGIVRSLVFALQTTFSAVLGDWAPIGAGAIKIPMTINAVLGILFVTFLIGAYGRKMLR